MGRRVNCWLEVVHFNTRLQSSPLMVDLYEMRFSEVAVIHTSGGTWGAGIEGDGVQSDFKV